MLTQRIAKNANTLLAVEVFRPEVAFQLDKDIHTFRDNLLRFEAGCRCTTQARLTALDAEFKVHYDALAGILGSLQRLVAANSWAQVAHRQSCPPEVRRRADDGLRRRGRWLHAGQADRSVRGHHRHCGTHHDRPGLHADSRERREQAERQRREAEAAKDATQEAILRLMNEMGDLADGDLTVRATVTEDITGAIADSVNYTIEELSVLVKRINDAAGRLTTASESAQNTSAELLGASRRQQEEIQDAGSQVLDMAHSMEEVSRQANESALVARHSLERGAKRRPAVGKLHHRMNDIRSPDSGDFPSASKAWANRRKKSAKSSN